MSEPDLVTSPESATSPAISAMGARGVHEFIRYFVASGIALCLDVGSLYVLTSIFTVPYLISAGVARADRLAAIFFLAGKSGVWRPHLCAAQAGHCVSSPYCLGAVRLSTDVLPA